MREKERKRKKRGGERERETSREKLLTKKFKFLVERNCTLIVGSFAIVIIRKEGRRD